MMAANRMLKDYPDLLSVQELQQALRVGRSTAYKLVESGEIRALRIGAIYRIPKKSILEYIKKNT